MNFPEVRPEDVFNWLMGVDQLVPGSYVVFAVFVVIAFLGGMRYRGNVERANAAERAKAAQAEAERIAAEQVDDPYDDPAPDSYRE